MSSPNLIHIEACECRLPTKHKGQKVEYDTDILMYNECRALFRIRPSSELWVTGNLDIINVLADTARDVLVGVDLTRYVAKLTSLYRNVPKPEETMKILLPNQPKLIIVE